MNCSKRLNNALNALYQGFYNGNLHPQDACRCAVGTICNGWDAWKHFSDNHGSDQLNYTGRVNQLLGKRFFGYTPLELLKIEQAFLLGCGYQLPLNHKNKQDINPECPEVLFAGLQAAIKQLCLLDKTKNPLTLNQEFLQVRHKKSLSVERL